MSGNSLIPPGNRPIKRQKQFPPYMEPFISVSTWLLEKVESLRAKQMERSASRWTFCAPICKPDLYHMESGGGDVGREYRVREKAASFLRAPLFLHEPPAKELQCEETLFNCQLIKKKKEISFIFDFLWWKARFFWNEIIYENKQQCWKKFGNMSRIFL